MKTTKVMLAALGFAALFTACDNKENENPTGSWQTAAPESVQVAEASTASKTTDITFTAPQGDRPGDVTLTSNYELTGTDSLATAYTIQATISGSWTAESGEDDDYILTFDRNTLKVSGTDAPVLGPVTDDFIASLAKYTKIEDVKVSKDSKQLKFEAGNPEVKYLFVAK